MARRKRLRPVKWAHLSEIDHRTKVGTPAWKRRHTVNQRKLSTWRYLHTLGNHAQTRNQARLRKRNPSSTMTLRQMLSSTKSLGG